jgi:hypothetical protein
MAAPNLSIAASSSSVVARETSDAGKEEDISHVSVEDKAFRTFLAEYSLDRGNQPLLRIDIRRSKEDAWYTIDIKPVYSQRRGACSFDAKIFVSREGEKVYSRLVYPPTVESHWGYTLQDVLDGLRMCAAHHHLFKEEWRTEMLRDYDLRNADLYIHLLKPTKREPTRRLDKCVGKLGDYYPASTGQLKRKRVPNGLKEGRSNPLGKID